MAPLGLGCPALDPEITAHDLRRAHRIGAAFAAKAALLEQAMTRIEDAAHKALDGGLKRPGHPATIGDYRRILVKMRTLAGAALEEARKVQP